MKLSIVTINRNNAVGLERTLQSVSYQTFKDFEYVIIDGASTDESVDVIKRYESQFTHLKWVSEPDKGIYNAMNKGIRMAVGEYVMILNSGDAIASEDVIEKMLEVLNNAIVKYEKVDILLGNIIHTGYEKVRKRHINGVAVCDPINVSMFTFYSGTVPHDAAFIRRDIYDRFGFYDENMKICSDWKLFLDIIAVGGIVPLYTNIDMVLFDMNGISEAGGVNATLIKQERRAYLKQVLQPSVLKDYDNYAADIQIMRRIHRHPVVFAVVHFMERVLFKFEKWFGEPK